MQGIVQAQPASRVSLAGVAQPLRRGPLTRLVLLAGLILAAPAWQASPAHALSFSAPTAFGVQNAPQSIAVGDFNGDSDLDLAVVNEFSHSVSILLGDVGGSFTTSTTIGVGNRPLWVAVGEFNGDSDPDLAVVNEGSDDVSILVGGAGASFSGPTNLAVGSPCASPTPCPKPQAVVVGKFDSNSDPDLAVVNEGTDDVSILLGSGATTASFSAPTKFSVNPCPATCPSQTPRAIAVSDFNGDSDPDLAVANEGSNDVSVLLGGSGGSFGGATKFPVGSKPTSVAVGEFNGDSDSDLAVANELTHNVSVLLGGAGGGFSAPTNFAVGDLPDTVAVGEFNGDSDDDLAVANQGTANVSLLFGGPAGGFVGPTNFAAGQKPTAVAVADFNGDSYADLAVANEAGASYQSSAGVVAILLATPPETTIDSGPFGFTGSSPTFTFSSNDPSSTFQCSVNGGSFSSCSSPHTRAGLSDGSHTFEVRATDDAGRTDPTPALRAFTVDTVPPSAPTVSGSNPASPANENNPRVKGTAAAGSTVRLYTTTDCSGSPAATGAAADFVAAGLQAPVPDNSTTRFRATATDEAGNVSACSTSSVAYTEVSPPPPVSNPGPPGGGGPPAGGPVGSPVGSPASPPVGGPVGLPIGGAAIPDASGPAMAVAGKALKKVARGAVSVALSCPASEPGGCTGTLLLETLAKVGGSKGAGRTRARKQKIKLGESAFQVAGGKTAAVKIRLSRRSQRLVGKLKRVRVLAIVNARDQVGNAQTIKTALVLTAAKLKAKR